MKNLICVLAIIMFLAPCVCLAETDQDRVYRETYEQMAYGMPKAEWDARYEKNMREFEERQRLQREEERHQEQMKELRRIRNEAEWIEMQQRYQETQRLFDGRY